MMKQTIKWKKIKPGYQTQLLKDNYKISCERKETLPPLQAKIPHTYTM